MSTLDPESPRAQFGLHFSMLARRWRHFIDARLAEVGLTDATWVPLVHLDHMGGGITQKTLAARIGVDSSSLVRVIDILSAQGLVERKRDAHDGRARLIDLTEQGKLRVAEIQRELRAAEASLLGDLSDDVLSDMLTRFAAIDARIIAYGDPEMNAATTRKPKLPTRRIDAARQLLQTHQLRDSMRIVKVGSLKARP